MINWCNWITAKVISVTSNLSFSIVNVYGPTSIGDKLAIWNKISNLFFVDPFENFILGGDFNTILDVSEHKACSNFLS